MRALLPGDPGHSRREGPAAPGPQERSEQRHLLAAAGTAALLPSAGPSGAGIPAGIRAAEGRDTRREAEQALVLPISSTAIPARRPR